MKNRKCILFCGLPLVVVEVGRNSDNSVINLFTKVAFSDLLHFSEDHRGNLLRGKRSILPIDLDCDRGLLVAVGDLKREMLQVGLDVFIRPFASNESSVIVC